MALEASWRAGGRGWLGKRGGSVLRGAPVCFPGGRASLLGAASAGRSRRLLCRAGETGLVLLVLLGAAALLTGLLLGASWLCARLFWALRAAA